MCNRRVGVAKAVSCTDCWRHRHRRCLNIKVNGVGKCLACTSLTQLANSPDQSYLNKILGPAYSGLEEEDDSDENSLRSKGGTASSRQSSIDSDAGEDTVTYRTSRDEIWQVSGANSTLLGNTSEITTAMDATAMQQMLDALFQKQEVNMMKKQEE
ncbi:MAG: hypothetical protein GY821_08055, partial [Gammaproteobacteria bacterium]|nr:hypothetical protein [Gammaproteobacteria bacterium]